MFKVSIIIATHNRPHLLPRVVESARNAGKDVEILVVDDASGEETAAVCCRLSGIRYLRVEATKSLGGRAMLGISPTGASSSRFLMTTTCVWPALWIWRLRH